MKTLKLSKSEWLAIGKTAGWIKIAERLFIIHQVDGMVALKDAKGFKLGTFKSAEEASKWAKDNGYEVTEQKP